MQFSPERRGNEARKQEQLVARTVPIDQAEYSSLLGAVPTPGVKRPKWDLVFSVGQKGNIFPPERWGTTPTAERLDVRGISAPLDRVADICFTDRGPGRYFVKPEGVFYKDANSQLHQAVRFDRRPGQAA